MGDDSKVVVGASASTTKEERPSRDYSTPITSDKLDGSNYASWSRGARITITSCRMASWINGKKPAPSKDSAAYAEWEEDNCLVQSWLLNSMIKPVRALFEHGATAFDIWEAARKTYTVTQNSSRLFQLRRQSILTCQNGESVKVFYEKLYAIWQEIDCLRPHEYSCADDGARRLKELEVDRVYDFLGGLDPPYDGVRSRILALSPVPPPLEAYAMVMEEDTRHSLDGPPKCRHCNGNHYSEKCFKEHGYPDWFADYKARMYGPKAACTMTQDETRPPAPSANLCASDTMPGTIHLTPSLPLSHALLVPNIRCNLLSVGRLLDTLNASATFYSTHCFFQDLKTHVTIGHGKRMGGNNKAALPFELVYSDVWGPARVTSHGFRWFVTFIDDCTRLTWVYLMKNKHDVASILPEFCAMVSTQFHASVKVFRTDNRGEYVNHTLTQFFRDQVARSLMLDMSVPHHLWGHGVLAAAYLINRTPSRVLDFKTPFDVLCAHTPPVSVSKLPPKVFGCVAYVHVYSHQRSKLDPCALCCVFIGYSTTQKGYKCYHPPSQKVHVTLDVTFHEEVPYYVSSSSPIQGENGSELQNFGMEDLGRKNESEGISDGEPTTGRPEDATGRSAICAKPTGLIEGDDRSPGTMRDECVETTGRPEDTTGRPAICDKPTGRAEGIDRSPVISLDEICFSPEECNSDISDSCEDEIDIRPPLCPAIVPINS
ncbi:unnamed protein product [Prunus brigantina]